MRRPEFNSMNASPRVVSITTGEQDLSCRAKSRHPLNLPVGCATGFLDSARNDACEIPLRMSMFQRIFIAAFVVITSAQFAQADSPSVTAVLNSSETVVGESVQLQIRLKGARGADAPERIAVDGLEIRRTGTSQHFEMNNFNVTSSVIYYYTILPVKSGTLPTPSQTIRVGNNSLRTPALTLQVAASPNGQTAQRRSGASSTAEANQLVFAELIVPKKSAFVGEMVPAQIRLGFDPRAHPQLIEPPEITGQGFTAQKLQQAV